MIDTIVYYSKTGFSKRYAEMIAEELDLQIFSLQEAKKKLSKNTEIIYISGLTATKIRKLGTAVRLFNVKYVLAVGMMDFDPNYESTIFANNVNLPEKVYYLPGGFDASKLKGLEKFSLSMLKKYFQYLKDNATKEGKELLPKDQKLLEELEKGSSDKVSKEYLKSFFNHFVR